MAEKYRPDVVFSKEIPQPQLLWTLGDGVTGPLVEQLEYKPTSNEIDFIIAASHRRPEALTRLRIVEGRSALFDTNPSPRILGEPYDVIQISGFGYQGITVSGSMSFVNPKDPVDYPSRNNFAAKFPSISTTQVIGENGPEIIANKFSFTGAYTGEQAVRKVAANLTILESLTGFGRQPFIVPVPIAIGKYPSIRDKKGKPAYFIAFREPYHGQRTGNTRLLTEEQMKEFGADKIESTPFVATPLRALHDLIGLTHNQATGGNYYVPFGEHPVYLADFGTVHPLPTHAEWKMQARIGELKHLIDTTINSLKSLFAFVDEGQIVPYLFSEVVFRYLGVDPKEHVRIPNRARDLKVALDVALRTIPPFQPYNSFLVSKDSLRKIGGYEREFRERIIEK